MVVVVEFSFGGGGDLEQTSRGVEQLSGGEEKNVGHVAQIMMVKGDTCNYNH